MKVLIGCYNKSFILTYIGVMCAVYGMFMTEDISVMMICLILAGVCDMFDGFIARRCKRTDKEKQFGIQLDSLCDVVDLLVFPTVILWKTSIQSNFTLPLYKTLVFLVCVGYIIAGIIRLAWFNITTDGNTKYYQGLPVTFGAFLLPLLYLGFRSLPVFTYIFPCFYLIIEFLFILNFELIKPGFKMLIAFSVMAILAILALIFL